MASSFPIRADLGGNTQKLENAVEKFQCYFIPSVCPSITDIPVSTSPVKKYREQSSKRNRNSAHPGGGYIPEGKGRQETRERIKQLPTETSTVMTNWVEASGAVAALDGVVGKAALRW